MNKSFKEILSNLLDNTNNLILYFGRIVDKTTEGRYSLDILNPIILTKLPSLYKFKIKGNEMLSHQISTKYGKGVNLNDLFPNMKPVSISYIYFPNKIYDIMLYQYTPVEGGRSDLVRMYEFNKMFIKCTNQHEIRVEMDKKDSDLIIQLITNICEDVPYKSNKKNMK